MNIHHLELFYYVARFEGISGAVRNIPYGIQQPAVSAQIRHLESAIGRRLFERRPFALTPAGRHIYEGIAPFFSGLPRLALELQEQTRVHLRLAASANVLREHLPVVLKQLRDRHAELRLTLREGGQDAAERMLLDQEVDVAVTLFNRPPTARLEHEVLLKLSMLLLVPARSRHTSAHRLLSEAPARGIPLVALPAREPLSALFHRELARRGLEWPARIEANDTALVESYVAQGFGIGLSVGPSSSPPGKGVRALRLRGFPQLVFGAIWTSPASDLVHDFLKLARHRADELAAAN